MRAKPYTAENPASEKAFERALKIAERSIEKKARLSSKSLSTKSSSGYFGHSFHADFCQNCEKDTAHKGYTCILCKTTKAPKPIKCLGKYTSDRLASDSMEKSSGNAHKKFNKRRYSFANQRVFIDKREAFKRQAEESRQKFESKIPSQPSVA